MPLLVTFFLSSVMELFEHDFQFLWDRKTQMSGILQKTHTLIGKVKENDSGPLHRQR